MDDVGAARKAIGRGRADEALVFLWNALEPARLARDRRALERIAELAAYIRAHGESVESREAERLLAAIAEDTRAEEPVTVTRPGEEVELPVGVGGEPGADEFVVDQEEAEAEAAQTRGSRGSSLFFLLVVAAIVVINIIRALTGGD